MKLVCPVSDEVEIVAAGNQSVNSIIDPNEADAFLWEVYLCVISHLQILTAKATEIFDDKGFHLTILDHGLGDAVLDAAGGIKVFQFAKQLGLQAFALLNMDEFQKRSLTN